MNLRKIIKVISLVVFSIRLFSPSLALADWGYTHWGMTPEQVVAGSGGTVKVLPQAQRTRDDADHWELAAEGTLADSGLSLPAGFTFDTGSGGLKCVMYNASGDDVQVLRGLLVRRYGKPHGESSFGRSRTITWKTPDEIEMVTGENPVAAVVTHCAPHGA